MRVFSKAKEVEEIIAELSLSDCEVYIDRELGEGQPFGEEVAEKFYRLGFEQIFLTTGHPPELFEAYTWLKCIDKACPWDKNLN